MDKINHQVDTNKSKMQVLELQELDAVEAGMAAAQWSVYSMDCDAVVWSTFSADCQ